NQATADRIPHAHKNTCGNGQTRLKSFAGPDHSVGRSAKRIKNQKWLGQPFHVSEEHDGYRAAREHGNHIAAIPHGRRWPSLDEETISQQTAAETAGERKHKHTDGIVVPSNGYHRSGYAEEKSRSQINGN